MLNYLLQRFWQACLVLIAVSILSFVLIYLSGDPIAALIPLNARQEDIDNIRRAYNLDQPLITQYWLFLGKALQGDMGESFRYRTDALRLVLGRLPNTMLLAGASLLLSSIIAFPLGIWAARSKFSPSRWHLLDHFISTGWVCCSFWCLQGRCAGCRPLGQVHFSSLFCPLLPSARFRLACWCGSFAARSTIPSNNNLWWWRVAKVWPSNGWRGGMCCPMPSSR